ncbi:MAG: 50S ribosomal protein L18e [Candidatus Aenigmarchaeota archaeon]|nr:50S ribosomal protein L18e [Candidatus Aenigmarchaeota archaeon]
MPHKDNPGLRKLIATLQQQREYKDIASQLAAGRRQRNSVNLWKINKLARSNESIVVPGKVLSEGELTKPVKVFAWQFSHRSKEKIAQAGGAALPLEEILKSKEKARIVV